MSKEQVEITDQDIFKALEVLGLNTSETEDNIEKSEKEEDKEKENPEKEESEENEEEFEKAYSELKKAYPKSCNKMMSKSEIKKSEEDSIGSNVIKLEDNDIIKGLSSKIDALSILYKKQDELYQNQVKVNDNLQKSLDEANSKLEEIGSQSNGRKSFMSSRKADYIEKAFGGEEISSDKSQLSLSRDKSKIDKTLLDLSNIEKGEVNEFWKDACLLFNTSGEIGMQTITRLSKEHNIQIVQ